jgi:hypothetical protein
VELASSLEEALLKGCPWMSIGSGENSEGEKDEASEQHAPSTQHSAVQESRAMSLFT